MGTAVDSTDFHFPGQKALYHGKVRDVYHLGDRIVAVATDRLSAFDVILPRPIPFKGQVLNQLSYYFLREADKVLDFDTWVEGAPDPNVTIGKHAEPIKVEVVVRGCLVGHAWREYQAGKRELCGVAMPDGLKEYDRFPNGPIITPTTKNDSGHDEPVTEAEIIAKGITSQIEWEEIKDHALKLFDLGQRMAKDRGLVLADTKYEFGRLKNRIILIDEVHTPDSSRYFYADGYDAYVSGRSSQKPKHLSKEFVREWLMERGFKGEAGQAVPAMTDEFVNSVSERYIELYQEMTGEAFVKAPADDILARIETNVTNYLKKGSS